MAVIQELVGWEEAIFYGLRRVVDHVCSDAWGSCVLISSKVNWELMGSLLHWSLEAGWAYDCDDEPCNDEPCIITGFVFPS
jgi:hypothetical protein